MLRRLCPLIVVVALFVACRASQAVDIPSSEPSIRGTITSVAPAAGGDPLGYVLIEEVPSDSAGSNKSRVRVTRDTRILVRDGAVLRRGTFADLLDGRLAEAWFMGPVMESYPTQATANVIVAVER